MPERITERSRSAVDPLVVGGKVVGEGKEMVYTIPRLKDEDAAVVSLERLEKKREIRYVEL